METKTPTESKSLHEYFQSKLNSMHKEIEEMALQFSLGKADAKDKFEEVKKEFKPQPKPRRSLVVSRSKFTGMPIEKQYKKPAMF